MCSLEHIRSMPDNYYDIVIADPPYGLRGLSRVAKTNKDNDKKKFNDDPPSENFFSEIFRVGKFQIIFGANNFLLPRSEYFFIWDKLQTVNNFASAEYAWTNIKMPAKVSRYAIHKHSVTKGERIHPTMKPISLYAWIFNLYAKKEWKILDPFGGSASSAIAAHKLGYNMTFIERDKLYFDKAKKRFDRETDIGLFDNPALNPRTFTLF
jgi:site-specific DNA-methyltransferase (adenine-specific)